MPQEVTCGQLFSAVSAVRDEALAALALLRVVNQKTIIGSTPTHPPVSPDWRCFCGIPADAFSSIDPVNPPTMDWRCREGVDVSVADLAAYLQAVADQCLIAIKLLEGQDPGRRLPT